MSNSVRVNHIKSYINKSKGILSWCVLCVIIFLISIFIHECGHGFANSLRGIECSTGFNRVGDIYKYPRDVDFRADYSAVSDSLLDFGVPATLMLAVIGTLFFCLPKGKMGKPIALGFAATNSVMRLIPCLFVVMVPLLTGRVHNEDEYGTGLALAEATGYSFLIYLPALISILVSVMCIACLYRKLKTEISSKGFIRYSFLTLFSFYITMIIANILDNIARINWTAIR